jgi:hypothetical protein
MGCLTFNTQSNRVVIISSVITRYFNPVQCRDGHISTCLIKTLVNYLYCAYCALCQLLFNICLSLSVIYLFVLVIRHCCSFILFIVRLFIHVVIQFQSFRLFAFIVFCAKQNGSILILDYVQVFRSCEQHHLCKSINIIQQTAPTLS